MDLSLIIQYIIVTILVLGAIVWVLKVIRKNFSGQKFKDSKPGCGSDCCS